jgi:glycosyltransferase 2 family protein
MAIRAGRSDPLTEIARPMTTSRPLGLGARNRVGVIGIVVSALLLVLLYRQLDRRAVASILLSAHPQWLVISVAMIAPITLIIALRFLRAAPAGSLPGFGEALRLTLVATAFNMFLPSKSGDLVKSYFVAKRGGVPVSVALAIVVYERLCDLVGVITWCMVGWLVTKPPVNAASGWLVLAAIGCVSVLLVSSERSAALLLTVAHWLLPSRRLGRLRNLAEGWPRLHQALRGRRLSVVGLSVGLWLVHLTQMWMFTWAVSASVPFAVGLGVFALASVAGQLPLTFAGFGARDVALVVLLSRYMTPEAAAAIGLLAATRGILPALAAIPILQPYLTVVVREAATWQRR